MTIWELPTPFLTVDLNAVDRNIDRMQRYCDAHGLMLRPHVKTHKMPRIAQIQLAAGATGIACQTLGEAEVMAANGFDDILITFPLIGTGRAARLAQLATTASMTTAVDSGVIAEELSRTLTAHGASVGVLVDCDTGFGRTGVQTPASAAALTHLIDRLPGLEFAGLFTHPATPESGTWLSEARELINKTEMAANCVSGGGTPGAFRVHENGQFTELRVGTYVYGDRRCLALGIVTQADCALRVVTTVVSRPTRNRAIVDAGSKTLSSDVPTDLDDGAYGLIVEYPEAALEHLSEEHGHLDLSRCEQKPSIGDVLTIIPNHACGAVNLHGDVALHRAGSNVEIAPIPARGMVR